MRRTLFLVGLWGCAPDAGPDGGWGGRAVCDDDSVLDTQAILDADLDTGALEGLFVLDLDVDFGLLGVVETVQRGTIADGQVSDDGMTLSGRLERDPNGAGGNTRNYAFDLTMDDTDPVLFGTLDWINGDGDSLLACELEMDKLHSP